ncbi:lasso peptide biosynthesis PqqD family chaperone [Paenibacillus arenilitoris]|uniref:Lasso peptide biosynthesis PqqD family chaperone n=1 Tax=Paenibacillus arenilitoris TaxID=2772299 RepID=A0A927H7V0_9BACL|nr:lasso peptide biosynthesis PqqD family chaperone [Paenibacillus arenilitoris]MBD2872026.1 lasso peptide biosynthesis PqqD family chaperone [Paenibacillus arenilitoris]
MANAEKIVLSDLITACEQNIVSDMGGEKVMLSVRNGNYYNLGAVGGRIWDLLVSPVTAGTLIDELLKEFDVERDVCERHVISFLEHLRKEGLIVVRPEHSAALRA